MILCVVGALCHREHGHHVSGTGQDAASNAPAPSVSAVSSQMASASSQMASASSGISSQPAPAPTPAPRPNVHNRIRIQFDGQDHQGWLLDCFEAQMEDSPTGCSAFPHHVVSSNTNHNRQECARKCQLNDQQIQFLNEKETKKSIKIEAWEFDQKHSHHAICELNWNTFLVGYNLQVHYLWVDHVETPFLEVKSCKAQAIESTTPLQTGDQFIATRELILDERINFLATVLSLSLMILAFTLLCCAMTCCVTCLCLKACEGSKMKRRNLRRARRNATKAAAKTRESDLEMNEMKTTIPQQTVPSTGVAPSQVPMYIPYYMFNPYSAGQVYQQSNGEQTFVMPNAPQV